MASLKNLFEPQSVAVVGASSQPEKAGYQMVDALKNFPAKVYPINPKGGEICGLTAYKSLIEVGEDIDLAVFALPANRCLAAAQDAADAGVKVIMIISGGFAETGEQGDLLQEDLIGLCRKNGIRLLGPNTSGFTVPRLGLQASFVPGMDLLLEGRIGIIAQSGAINVTLAALAADNGAGVSVAVGIGNGVDITSADVIDYLADDESTDVIAVYLEGVSDGRKLYEVVRRTTPRKPVVVYTVGKADVGEFAASHTGNLMGSWDVKLAALKQAGAVVVNSTHELISVAKMFCSVRLSPAENPGVALVTGQAGPAMIISDYLKHHGVTMPSLTHQSVESICELLPPMTYLRNPVDTGRPGPNFADIAELTIKDPSIDLLIVFALHEPAAIDPCSVATQVKACSKKPVIFGTAGSRKLTSQTAQDIEELGVPAFFCPEDAAIGARALVEDARRQANLISDCTDAAVGNATNSATPGCDEHEAKKAIEALGITCPKRFAASTQDEALSAFRELPKPLAVKVLSKSITHKTDVGGVYLNINTEEDLRNAINNIDAIPTDTPKRYLIEAMAEPGLEVIIGGTNDPSFGPTVLVGIGGTAAEAMGDVSIRMAPLSHIEAAAMVKELRASALFDGWRGSQKLDVVSLSSALVAVGDLLVTNPSITEIDLNPVRIYPHGIIALDALIV